MPQIVAELVELAKIDPLSSVCNINSESGVK